MHAAAQFHLGTSTRLDQDDVNEVILKLHTSQMRSRGSHIEDTATLSL